MTLASQREAWSSPPLDDIGYVDADYLLSISDREFRHLIMRAIDNRYRGWRNDGGRWRTLLQLDTTEDKCVLDYGCGVGIEALQYVSRGNLVWLADISEKNLQVATRTLNQMGYEPEGTVLIGKKPAASSFPKLDIVHCCGVLHHIRKPAQVVQAMQGWLVPEGELRLMLYSDEGWRLATGTEPPVEVTQSPHFKTWVRWNDGVGDYADWYDCSRLDERFGNYFRVAACDYITRDERFLIATLVTK